MTKEIDITPKTHALVSLRRQDMPPWLAICELVDNSLDANAATVDCMWDPAARVMSIRDDGVGAPNPAAIVTIGDHDSEGRDTSGRYGIGAKDAVLALGTAAEVATFRNGLHRTVRADFEEIRQSGRWIAREEQEPAASATLHGTSVTVMGVDRNIRPSYIVERLSKTFAPALRLGRIITFCGKNIEAPSEILVDDRREGSGVFRGKHYSWWCGIRRDGQRVDGGWRFEFKHRVMDENSCNRSYGTDGMDIHKFYGVVTLLEPEDADEEERWSVNKHKTSSDELQDLCESIFPEVSDLLERSAAEHAVTIESEIADEVGRGLTQALGNVSRMKEKRSRGGDEHGTVDPRNTGIRRRRASKTQAGDGSITMRDPYTGKTFRIVVVDDDDRFGWVTGSRTANVVYLGKAHDYWQQHSRDADLVRLAAVSLLAGHAVTTDGVAQPIMSAIVRSESANQMFFETFGNIAGQVACADELRNGSHA
jgi:hypothetical protein